MSARKVRRLLAARRESLQAILAWRKFAGHDPDQGEAEFLRGLAAMVDGSRVRSLSANDLYELADKLDRAPDLSTSSRQYCDLHDRHRDDPRHRYVQQQCEKWLRASTPSEERAVVGHRSRLHPEPLP